MQLRTQTVCMCSLEGEGGGQVDPDPPLKNSDFFKKLHYKITKNMPQMPPFPLSHIIVNPPPPTGKIFWIRGWHLPFSF